MKIVVEQFRIIVKCLPEYSPNIVPPSLDSLLPSPGEILPPPPLQDGFQRLKDGFSPPKPPKSGPCTEGERASLIEIIRITINNPSHDFFGQLNHSVVITNVTEDRKFEMSESFYAVYFEVKETTCSKQSTSNSTCKPAEQKVLFAQLWYMFLNAFSFK